MPRHQHGLDDPIFATVVIDDDSPAANSADTATAETQLLPHEPASSPEFKNAREAVMSRKPTIELGVT